MSLPAASSVIHPIFGARRAGVLLHLTSLPSRHGIGDLGPGAHRFVRWLRQAGISWWQVLPVGPIGACNSPYASSSSFAGEPLLISLEELASKGLLDRRALRVPVGHKQRQKTDYSFAQEHKMPRLEDAYRSFARKGGFGSSAYRSFARRSSTWLPGWLRFRGEGERGVEAFSQFCFQSQWDQLRARAKGCGVSLMGDLPIFVAADSADVRANPELFRLDRKGNPTVLTGVPPDNFSRDGQLWGHPHYRWEAHARTGFAWWINRVAWSLERFDALRIDHFIGLVRAWEVPAGSRTARKGRWGKSKGAEMLRALHEAIGPLPLVAEDLGAMTPAVQALRDRWGLPGMKIVQWAFDGPQSPELPSNHPSHSIAYPGTHDNDTASGWWKSLGPKARRRVRALVAAPSQLGRGGGGQMTRPARVLTRLTLSSPARTAIIPMQDLLELGPETRMNLPGTTSGNWEYMLSAAALDSRTAVAVRSLIRESWRDITMVR